MGRGERSANSLATNYAPNPTMSRDWNVPISSILFETKVPANTHQDDEYVDEPDTNTLRATYQVPPHVPEIALEIVPETNTAQPCEINNEQNSTQLTNDSELTPSVEETPPPIPNTKRAVQPKTTPTWHKDYVT